MTPHNALRRHAVFVSAGDHHRLHKDPRRTRNFDLVIAWYGSDEEVARQLRSMADAFFEIKGGKFENLRSLWVQRKISLESYESVFVADDDVDLSPEKIELLFRRREVFDAWILTPAHLHTGRVSYRTLAYRPHWSHHFTNFIEECTPVFETAALVRFLREFDGSVAGWGVDHWYMNVLGPDEPNRFVVDHSVRFFNPKSRAGGRREIELIGNMRDLRSKWICIRDDRGLRDVKPTIHTWVRASPWVAVRRTVTYFGCVTAHTIGSPHKVSAFARRVRRRIGRRLGTLLR
ncbi:MAG: hypothetical protein RLZ37_422 [Actinomycetota bacterium]